MMIARRPSTLLFMRLLAAVAAAAPLAHGIAQETPLKEPDISIGVDISEVRTGHLQANARAEIEPLAAPVQITIQNRTATPLQTAVEITGTHRDHARVDLVKTEDTDHGQILHLNVYGLKPTFENTEVLLTLTLRDGETVKATRSLPVRVSAPTLLKLDGEVLHDGPAVPGLVNRALNMRTTPKAAVPYPEARLATMCLHDVSLTVLDQFGDPLPPVFAGAPVWAALGKSDYESTNRTLRADGSFIDSIGFWQFVSGVDDMSVEPGRTHVQQFMNLRPPPCSEQQYTTYEPLLIQYQIGGYPVGTYRRQVTLKNSGDDHKPDMHIIFKPVEDPPAARPSPK